MGSESIKTKLGEICNFSSGSAFPKDYQGQAVGKYPFIKVSDLNISGNERHILGSNNWLDELNFKELGVKLHPKEAVVFAKIGVALTYNRRRILTMDTIIDNNMMSASPLKSHVSPLFFFYLLRTIDFNMYSVGTALPYLNISDLRQITVEIPDMQTQKAIEAVLGSLDDKIELNRQINEKLEGIAQALFKSWFMDFDPVRAKSEGRDTGLPEHISSLFPASFMDSELGQIPEGWKVSSLSDAVGFIKGKKPITTSKVKREGFSPQILIETFDTGKFIYADREGMVIASSEDVLMVMDGASSGRIERGYSGIVGSTLSIVSSKALPRTYLYSYLKTLQEDIQSNTTGSAIPHTDKARILSYRTALPNQGILKAFDKVVKQSFDRVIVSREEIKMLIFLRDTLLPKLISGELPIPDAERIVGRYL